MAWVKLSEKWWSEPRMIGAPLAARGLDVAAMCWSSAHGLGGFVPRLSLREIAGGDRRAKHAARALEASGKWVWDAERKGWQIDGYLVEPERGYITSALRQLVLERDEWRCCYCGSTADLTLDHIFPVALGGCSTEDNLQVLCRRCNSAKGARV